jgi:hypothetical protein
VLKVSRWGYYDWRSRRPSARDVAGAYLLDMIIDVHAAARGACGARRLTDARAAAENLTDFGWDSNCTNGARCHWFLDRFVDSAAPWVIGQQVNQRPRERPPGQRSLAARVSRTGVPQASQPRTRRLATHA